MVTDYYYLAITLVTAHILGDFLLQTDNDIKEKDKPLTFIKHILVVTFTSYLLLGIWSNWYIPLIIFITHALLDKVKLELNSKAKNCAVKLFLLDQIGHLAVISVIVFLWGTGEGAQSLWLDKFGKSYPVVLTYAGGLVLTVIAGGVIIGMLVNPFIEEIKKDGGELKGLKNGGKSIGLLERLLIFFFLVAGSIEAVGFLIAAKSILRFSEIRTSSDRKQVEYILIGTLYSFAWGLFFSWLTLKIAALI